MDQFDSHTESLQKSLGPKIVLPSEEEGKRKKEAEKILFKTCPRLHYTQREGVKVLIDGKKKGFHAILNKLAIEERLSAIYVSRKPKSFKIFHYFSDKEIDALETYAKTLYGKILLSDDDKCKRRAEKTLFSAFPRGMYDKELGQEIKELIDNLKQTRTGKGQQSLFVDLLGNSSWSDDEIAAFETYAKTLHGEVLFTEEEKRRHLIKDRQESFLVSGHSFRIGEVVEEKEGEIHHLQAPRSYL